MRESSYNLATEVFYSLCRALKPFNPGHVRVTAKESIFDLTYWKIDASNYPEFPCFVDEANLWFPLTIEETRNMIIEKVFLHFRNIPALPVDDNIVLGEN